MDPVALLLLLLVIVWSTQIVFLAFVCAVEALVKPKQTIPLARVLRKMERDR